MIESTSMQKARLREEVRERLGSISPAERAIDSKLIRERLEQLAIWQEARSILFFAPTNGEPDIWPMVADALAGKKQVVLPRFCAAAGKYEICEIRDLAKEIVTGKFGIRESSQSSATFSLNQLDLILVPGLAFDEEGRRLGRGKGYYDQLLDVLHGLTCGVAFDQQIVSRIPVEPHDVVLNCILTPTRWHQVAGPRPVLK